MKGVLMAAPERLIIPFENYEAGRFTLLDETKKVKSVVATQEIMDVSFALEAFAAKQRNGLLQFCAAPQFETEAEDVDLHTKVFREAVKELVG